MKRRIAVVVAMTLAALFVASCSTSGRALRTPTQSTLAPSLGSSTSTTLEPKEGRGGLALSSPAFLNGNLLPLDSGAATGNRSPAIEWTNAPEDAAELALVATDPTGQDVHWLVTGLQATDISVQAGTPPLGGTVRENSAGRVGWTGPVTPEGGGVAVIVFRLYALDKPLVVAPDATPADIVARIESTSFATATLSASFTGQGAALRPN
jgi:hypothetical protein